MGLRVVAGSRVPGGSVKGSLQRREKGALWQLFSDLAGYWDMTTHLTIDRAAFDAFLELKTNWPTLAIATDEDQISSFYEEYQTAVSTLEELEKGGVSGAQELIATIREVKTRPQDVTESQLKALTSNVVLEFVTVALVSGGFRRFDPLKNIKGYAGGGWDSAGVLPFRPAQ